MNEEIHWFAAATPLNALSGIFVKEYKRSRYLRHLSNEELDTRIADIVSNLMHLDDDGKYRPRFRVRDDGVYAPIRGLDFLRMATEAWTESQIRGADSRKSIDSPRLQIAKRLSDESWCRRPDWIAQSRLSLDAYERPRMLFRFSDSRWNGDLLRNGRIRISPASSYGDTLANNARRDDELKLSWYDTSLTLKTLETRDYFCLCLSSEYDYRLFSDFQSNSCVAITNPNVFYERLRVAIEKHNTLMATHNISRLQLCPVIYVDPFALVAPETPLEVQFCKHFRFAYQTEFRVVLTPVGNPPLDPFFLNVGAISDIAEIVEAPNQSLRT